jgi:hypothetical protein
MSGETRGSGRRQPSAATRRIGTRRLAAPRSRWAVGAVGAAALALAAGLVFGRGGMGAVVATRTQRTGDYRLTSIGGQSLAFPDRSKPTLLYFMSASCSSCWQGDHQLAQIYPQLRGRAEVVSLDVTPQVDTPSQLAQMARATGAVWPQAFATSSILARYGINDLDTVVIVSPNGKVAYDGAMPSRAKLLTLIRRTEGPSPV